MGETELKYQNLKRLLREKREVLVAFSGGADSAFLLNVAHEVLGDHAIAVTAKSSTLAEEEYRQACLFAKQLGVEHIILEYEEMDNPEFAKNPSDRCYFCKTELFSRMQKLAEERKIPHILDGFNYDDLKDIRPGAKAAKELNVESPLFEANLTKQEIRTLSRQLGLPTWDKPAMACLSSRIAYGHVITKEKLSMVEQAEAFLKRLGMVQVRVRHHEQIARIEVLPEDMETLLEHRKEIVDRFKEIGFIYVTIDLQGFRSGSMNEALKVQKIQN